MNRSEQLPGYTVLVVEDDREINALICSAMRQNRWNAVSAFDGLSGLQLARSSGPDLIILDLMLPYKSGDMLLCELRRASSVPVLVLSAKQLTSTKVELLRAGADDYLAKPFDLDELLARAEALLRRSGKREEEAEQPIQVGPLTIWRDEMRVSAGEQDVTLTAKEYQLLLLLSLSPRRVFSKQNLYESIWNEPYTYDEHTINTHVSNLRKKLRDAAGVEMIETVWGLGYKLRAL